MRETWVWYLGWEDPLEKEMATHSSTLAWKIPWMEKSSRLQSMRLQRVGSDWATHDSALLACLLYLPHALPTATPSIQSLAVYLEYNTIWYHMIQYNRAFAWYSSRLVFQLHCSSLFSYSFLGHSDSSPILVLGMPQAFSCLRNKFWIQVFSVFVEKSAVRSNICSCEYVSPPSHNLWLILLLSTCHCFLVVLLWYD